MSNPNHKLNLVQEKHQPWYAEGLSFKCTECGKCCTGAPGYVWVSEEEIATISTYLKISLEEFKRSYLRRIDERYSLVEKSPHYDCVFLKNRKCQIYSVRPKQCRTFPWWPQNLTSKEAWNEAAQFCEGIDLSYEKIPLHTIEEQLKLQESP